MKNIMGVDDSRFWRKIVINSLKKANYNVVAEAGDGEEAVDLFLKYHPDLITMDMIMPKQSGIETIKQILKIDPSVKIIAMTALGHSPIVEQTLSMGVSEVLIKPVTIGELIETIDTVTNQMNTVNPNIGIL